MIFSFITWAMRLSAGGSPAGDVLLVDDNDAMSIDGVDDLEVGE